MARAIAGKLTDGILARIEYDFVCNRGSSFGESYLHEVISNIITANIDPSQLVLERGYPHPAIRNGNKRAGRDREIDFFLHPRGAGSSTGTCIEVKWAGSAHCTPQNVLIDLCRLSAIAAACPGSQCVFVLAGSGSSMKRLFRKSFMAPSGADNRRLLQIPGNRPSRRRTYPLIVDGGYTEAVSNAVKNSVPALPQAIHSILIKPTFTNPKWQSLVWVVTASSSA